MNRPLVSIIIPSYNQGRYIRETVQSCLDQDYRPIEVLVFDGASKDETIDILESFDAPELKWWSEPDEGVVDAVNKGLQQASGDILTIQSSDDVFMPGTISAAVDVLLQNPAAGLVYGDIEHINSDSRVIGKDIQGVFNFAEYLGRFMYIPQPGTCFTRSAMQAVGEWRSEYSYAADADFWMRIAAKFPVCKIDRITARYRYHADQRDTQSARIARDWEGAVNALLCNAKLTSRQRRYARMGIHLGYYRYAPETAWIKRTVQLYAALLINPASVSHVCFPKRELLPGRTPIWAGLSRVKRMLGFKPRT